MKTRRTTRIGGVVYLIALLLVVVLTELDYGDSEPGRFLVGFMKTIVPMIQSAEALSGGSSKIEFYYSLFWCTSPLGVWLGWRLRKEDPTLFGSEARTDMNLVATVLFAAGCDAVAIVWPIAGGGRSWRDSSLVSGYFSSLSYIVATVCMFLATGAACRMVYCRLRTRSTLEPK